MKRWERNKDRNKTGSALTDIPVLFVSAILLITLLIFPSDRSENIEC